MKYGKSEVRANASNFFMIIRFFTPNPLKGALASQNYPVMHKF
jgi:hypothetical protein